MRTLVVEDEPTIHQIYEHFLKPAGHQLEFAFNGDEGFRLYCERGPYDLVLTDFAHLGMDGLGLLNAIQQRNPQQASGLVTSNAQRLSGFVTGHPVLEKPFGKQQLLDFVDRLQPR